MGSKKNRNAIADAAAQAEQDGAEAAAEQSNVAVLAPEPVATPESKRGPSAVKFPVAMVWLTAHNMITAAKAAGEPKPSRKHIVATCIAAGVGFYTARTQVQAYLKASKGGEIVPAKFPKGVQIASV